MTRTVFAMALAMGLVEAHKLRNSTHATLPRVSASFGVDPSIDCPLRVAAWNFSSQIQPQWGNQVAVFDALQLGVNCGIPRPTSSDIPTRKHLKSFTRSIAGETTFFVDSISGSDSNPGTLQQPFQSLPRGVQATRELGPGPASIILRNGTYCLAAPIALGAADSGLTITNCGTEEAVVSGGVPLPQLTWAPYNVGMAAPIDGASNVYQCVNGSATGTAGECEFLGQTTTSMDCATLCSTNTACSSWSWYGPNTGVYLNQCFSRIDGTWSITTLPNMVSGQKLNTYVADLSGVTELFAPILSLFAGPRRAIRARYPSANPETYGLHTIPTGYARMRYMLFGSPSGVCCLTCAHPVVSSLPFLHHVCAHRRPS